MILPERIRFDDVITISSDPKIKGKEFQKFFKHIKWCLNIKTPLTPAILCEDIENFPGGIKLIREMTNEGILFPDLHGWDHGPYGERSQTVIEEHLDKAQNWFMQNIGVLPIRWVTPHGADSPEIQSAAIKYNLIVETTRYPVVDQKAVDSALRKYKDLSALNNIVIMVHWWERGLRLYRIAKIVEYQSITAAKLATSLELTEKEYKICWQGW